MWMLSQQSVYYSLYPPIPPALQLVFNHGVGEDNEVDNCAFHSAKRPRETAIVDLIVLSISSVNHTLSSLTRPGTIICVRKILSLYREP